MAASNHQTHTYIGMAGEGDYIGDGGLFRKADGQGDAGGQNNLGTMYTNGRGVERDFAKAVYWIRKSAEQGFARAQYSLGYTYQHRRDGGRDFVKAVHWYRKAAEQGHEDAKKKLAELRREEIAKEKAGQEWLATQGQRTLQTEKQQCESTCNESFSSTDCQSLTSELTWLLTLGLGGTSKEECHKKYEADKASCMAKCK